MDEKLKSAMEDLAKYSQPVSPYPNKGYLKSSEIITIKKNWVEKNILIFSIILAVFSTMIGAIFQWLTGLLPQLHSLK